MPPKTWEQVFGAMKNWESWSSENATLPAPLRAAILHAWLTHVHPYVDGNGRTSRAIGNLELIRAGYPPIIIKKKERQRYLDALAESDEGGDIRSFLELIFDRIDGALTGLEASAKRRQGYDPIVLQIRGQHESRLRIWHTAVRLLAEILEHELTRALEPVGGACSIRIFDDPLDLEDYVELCSGRSVSRSWAFVVRLEIPSVSRLEKLAFMGHRSTAMFHHLDDEGGPSLFWSSKNPDGFPKWTADADRSPYAAELTARAGNGDAWIVRRRGDVFEQLSTTQLASKIAGALLEQARS